MINLGTTTQKAIKPHWCDNCGKKISQGQAYIRSRIVDGSEAWVWKSHEHCQKASQILWDAGIEGDEGCLVRVEEMDAEDRAMVAGKAPEVAALVWPDRYPMTPTPQDRNSEGTPAPQMPTHIAGFRS